MRRAVCEFSRFHHCRTNDGRRNLSRWLWMDVVDIAITEIDGGRLAEGTSAN